LETALRKLRPTDAALTVLRALWRRGPSTVKQVHAIMSEERELGYTTVLKMLQVMTGKGLVERDSSERSHVYTPTRTEDQTQHSLVDDLVSRAFGGSATKLVMQALSARPASKEELAQIRELLDCAEGQTPLTPEGGR
jgi:predicted transcriptional regulator